MVLATVVPKLVICFEDPWADLLSSVKDPVSPLICDAAEPAPDAAELISLTPFAVAPSVAPRSNTFVSLVSFRTAPDSFSNPVPAFSAAVPIESKIPATDPRTPSTPPEIASMTSVIPSETVVTVPSTVSPILVTMELISGAFVLILSTKVPTESVTLAIPVQARSTPPPIARSAAPNTPIPTAPAVSAGPHAAATPMSAPMPIAIPARVAIAGVPASETSIAESASTLNACAAMYRAAAAAIIEIAPAAAPWIAPPAADTGAAAVPAALAILPSPPVRLPIPPTSDEIPLTAFPPITSSGPATAATPAIFRIVSCISGLSPFQASLSFSTPSVRPPTTSVINGPAASTRSAPRSFSSLRVV